MYHYVRDSASTAFPAIRALSPADFERQLDWLQRDYDVLTPSAFDDAVRGGGPLPENTALLTFDDGVIDHYEVAFPILRRRGLSGVFFVAGDAGGTDPRVLSVHKIHFLLARLGAERLHREVVEACHAAAIPARGASVFGVDDWEQANERAVKNLLNYDLPFADAERVLGELFARHIGDEGAFARGLYVSDAMVAEMAAAGMQFGYHTRTHRMLSRLDVAEQDAELAHGVEWVRARTGQAEVPFCYPWGGPGTYTADTVGILERVGYSVAYNTVRRRAVPGTDGRFELPRVDTRDLPPYTAGEAVASLETA